MNNPRILAVLTIVFWSFSSLLAKLISIRSPYLLFSFSFSFAILVYLIYALRLYGTKLFFQKIKKLPIKYFILGLTGYYAVWVGNTESFIAYDSASETTILNYTWLIFTVFFSETVFHSLRGKFTLKVLIEYLGIAAAFFSIYILALEGKLNSFDFTNSKGILWGLFGGISYGFFSAYSGTIDKNQQPVFLLSAVFAGLIAMLVTTFFTTNSFSDELQNIQLSDILLAAALGILVDAFGYIMWTRSLSVARNQKLNVAKVVSIVFVLPVTSLVIISLFLKEYTIFKPYFLASLGVLIIGALLAQRSQSIAASIRKKTKKH